MEPATIGVIAAAGCIVTCAAAAVYSIKTCGTALASVTSEKPELGTRLLITIILGEALAIYGLLISFMIISQVPLLTTVDEAYPLFPGAAFPHSPGGFSAAIPGIRSIRPRPDALVRLLLLG